MGPTGVTVRRKSDGGVNDTSTVDRGEKSHSEDVPSLGPDLWKEDLRREILRPIV